MTIHRPYEITTLHINLMLAYNMLLLSLDEKSGETKKKKTAFTKVLEKSVSNPISVKLPHLGLWSYEF